MINFYYYNHTSSKIQKFSTGNFPAFFGYDSLVKCKAKKIKFINHDLNVLFVLNENLVDKNFYKEVSEFFNKEDKIIPLLTIGFQHINSIDTYLPKNFLDSSIWNYYIAVENPKEETKKISQKIEKVLGIIKNNYENKLYNFNASKEFIEFNYRLLANSHLYEIEGEHAKHVSPFVFHSEYEMKKNARGVLEEIAKYFPSGHFPKIQWRVLLIDDYANKPMRGKDIPLEDEEDDYGIKHSKSWVFNALIRKFLPKNYPKTNKTISVDLYKAYDTTKSENNLRFEVISTPQENIISKVLDTKTNENEANNNKSNEVEIKYNLAKNENFFDIYLIDYLLGYNEKERKREYGDEFLKKLKDKITGEKAKIFKTKQGPLGKFWILPISSFNFALISKLNEQGIEKVQHYWYIMDGADLINTPSLFLYHFFNLLKLQLDQAIVTKENILDFILDNLIGNNNKDIGNNETMSIRTRARRLYGLYMHRFGLREALQVDANNGSAFATSVLEYLQEHRLEDYYFYENVRKLLYLIGFGNHTDVPKMRRVFISILDSIEFKEKDKDKEEVETMKAKIKFLSKKISDYIDKLSE